jgi:formylglycine-generating enzyme required for sulfatase activity
MTHLESVPERALEPETHNTRKSVIMHGLPQRTRSYSLPAIRRVVFSSFFAIFLAACSREPMQKPVALERWQNSIGMEFVLIPAGSFIMGEATRAECTDCNARPDETPRHAVTIDRPFYLGIHEVTQKQYLSLMKDNPSRFNGDQRPVESVSWQQARLLVEALNRLENTQAYRLPTEAEWEYAARAGSTEAYHFGDRPRALVHYAWMSENAGGRTHSVGEKHPNRWGLYDMYGNVFEWCEDWYSESYYQISPKNNPQGPAAGTRKVKRGGSLDRSARSCRSSARDSAEPRTRSDNTGFRIVRDY